MPPRHVQLTRLHLVLIWVVITGVLIVAGIGFVGSYAAVHELALRKGFGAFAYVFPIGIDCGIVCLLSLDLLLTWIRMPFPMLRHTAWLLTLGTIAFNAASAWGDPLATAMHGIIPCLFVVAVEAARHAVGRLADITADQHMESVRVIRWILSPLPTFLLWRKMKLWELRSYDAVIKLEQDRLVYRTRLHARFGRRWRRKAPVESLMPLRLARYGVALADTAAAGLSAAGIEPDRLPATGNAVAPLAGQPAPGPPHPAGPEDDETAPRSGPTPSPPATDGKQPAPVAAAGTTPEPGTKDGEATAGTSAPPPAETSAPNDLASTPSEREGPPPEATSDTPAGQEEQPPGQEEEKAAAAAAATQHPAAEIDDEHTRELATITKHADAVRYAIEQTASLDKQHLTMWLDQRGRSVNRGTIHKIVTGEKRQRAAAEEPLQQQQQQPGKEAQPGAGQVAAAEPAAGRPVPVA